MDPHAFYQTFRYHIEYLNAAGLKFCEHHQKFRSVSNLYPVGAVGVPLPFGKTTWTLTDGQWAALEPLTDACRPPAKVAPQNFRETISAILWRHQNGAKWRAVLEAPGPWWRAARSFIGVLHRAARGDWIKG